MKTAIITGAAQGIGKSTAFKFAKEGYQVLLIDIKREVEKVAEEINQISQKEIAFFFVADVSNSSQVKNACKYASEIFNHKIDVLVNNAGIVPLNQDNNVTNFIENISDDDLESIFQTNIFSMFYFCREIVPIMKKRKKGAIVNVGSVAVAGLLVNSHYSSSKAAVVGLTRTLAKELAECNINVFCVAPGLVDTSLIGPMTEEQKKIFIQTHLTKELIPAWEVANLILFLANPDSKNLTGQILNVNAGRYLA